MSWGRPSRRAGHLVGTQRPARTPAPRSSETGPQPDVLKASGWWQRRVNGRPMMSWKKHGFWETSVLSIPWGIACPICRAARRVRKRAASKVPGTRQGLSKRLLRPPMVCLGCGVHNSHFWLGAAKTISFLCLVCYYLN